MIDGTNNDTISREEMLHILEFHFLTRNYSKNYLDNLTDQQLRVEYEKYIQKEEFQQ